MHKGSYLVRTVGISHEESPSLLPQLETRLGAHALLMVNWYHPLCYAKQIIISSIITMGGVYSLLTICRELCSTLNNSLSPHNPVRQVALIFPFHR